MRRRVLLILCVVLFLSLLGLLWTSWVLTPLSSSAVPVEVEVGDEVGIKLDADKLYFGTVPDGNVARRPVEVVVSEDSFVVLQPRGNISSWLYPARRRFLLEGGGNASVDVRLHVPRGASDGVHTGELGLVVYRPGARLLLGGE